MLDNRTPVGYRNRWLPNENQVQTLSRMNAVNNFDGRDTPPGPVLMEDPFLDSAYLPIHYPSVGSPYDINDYDRPATDNGLCQTPSPDSTYSDNMNRGTPNSFVGDYVYDSPRERLLSTSSSTYTYSPYNPHGEDNATTPRNFHRQTSAEMVEEFFNRSSCAEECGLQNSQGFSTEYAASTMPAQSIVFNPSEVAEVLVTADIPTLVTLSNSPPAESSQTQSSSADNDKDTSNPSPVSQSTSDNQLLPPASGGAFVLMGRQMSTLSQIISETIPTDSQDALMVQDCVDNFEPAPTCSTVDPTQLYELSVQEIPLQENSNPTNSENCALKFNQHAVSKDPITARREKNNAACRASRKRRKDKKNELENSISTFEKENGELRNQIEYLEIECKRMKEEIVNRMHSPR